MKVILTRLRDDGKETLGRIDVYDDLTLIWSCKTVELPWRNNQRNISCIPSGTYQVKWSWSPKFERNLFLVQNVTGRSGIRIHVANFVSQLAGCIAMGYNYYDINNDGILDVQKSGICLSSFHDLMYENFELKII